MSDDPYAGQVELTVGILRSMLQDLDDDMPVVVCLPDSAERYGQGYSAGVDKAVGEVGFETQIAHPDDVKSGYYEGATFTDCFVIAG